MAWLEALDNFTSSVVDLFGRAGAGVVGIFGIAAALLVALSFFGVANEVPLVGNSSVVAALGTLTGNALASGIAFVIILVGTVVTIGGLTFARKAILAALQN